MVLKTTAASLVALSFLLAQQPDNTKRNERDRAPGAVTADQQKETPQDRDLTQKIRKAVVDSAGMSTNGKNVKIISIAGKVTLRGPVNSLDEKQKIEQLAKSVAGADNVISELEVKGEGK